MDIVQGSVLVEYGEEPKGGFTQAYSGMKGELPEIAYFRIFHVTVHRLIENFSSYPICHQPRAFYV